MENSLHHDEDSVLTSNDQKSKIMCISEDNPYYELAFRIDLVINSILR